VSRKKIGHSLTPLPKGPRLTRREHKTERLLEVLRAFAIRNQKEESQPFYPIRKVATHFHVSPSMIATAYERLEDEGLLSTIRGSGTVLQGRAAVRHLRVLGFIGLPAAVSSFIALQDYRMFFVRVRRELRARGFAVAMVLFDSSDIGAGRLSNRMSKYDFDTVLWFRPDASARDVISRLADKGVRVVAVNDHHLSPVQNRYEIRREDAILKVLRYWRSEHKISSTVIVRGVKAAAKEETLQQLLQEEHFRFEFRNAVDQSAARFLDSLGRMRNKGIIFPSWAASQFSFREPEALMELAQRSRIAFTGGPPSIPFAQVRDVRAELVIVDWQLLAEKIVDDLISKKAFDRSNTTMFKAKAHIRASLGDYSQVI
jgi:hypothetical protein